MTTSIKQTAAAHPVLTLGALGALGKFVVGGPVGILGGLGVGAVLLGAAGVKKALSTLSSPLTSLKSTFGFHGEPAYLPASDPFTSIFGFGQDSNGSSYSDDGSVYPDSTLVDDGSNSLSDSTLGDTSYGLNTVLQTTDTGDAGDADGTTWIDDGSGSSDGSSDQGLYDQSTPGGLPASYYGGPSLDSGYYDETDTEDTTEESDESPDDQSGDWVGDGGGGGYSGGGGGGASDGSAGGPATGPATVAPPTPLPAPPPPIVTPAAPVVSAPTIASPIVPVSNLNRALTPLVSSGALTPALQPATGMSTSTNPTGPTLASLARARPGGGSAIPLQTSAPIVSNLPTMRGITTIAPPSSAASSGSGTSTGRPRLSVRAQPPPPATPRIAVAPRVVVRSGIYR